MNGIKYLRNLSEEEKQLIISFYTEPNSLRETSKYFNIERSALKDFLIQNNIPINSRESTKAKAQQKLQKTCMERYGVTNGGAYNYIKGTGRKLSDNPEKYKQKVQESKDLVNFIINNIDKEEFITFYKMHNVEETLNKYNINNTHQLHKILLAFDYDFTFKKGLNKGKPAVRTHESYVKGGYKAQEKIYKTKKLNNSFNTSKPEEDFYKLLLNTFTKNDIFRQYKSEKYPFACDFYIKNLDLYIELNINWTHGGHLFNKDCQEDLMQLEKWKNKNSDFYNQAIKTWTLSDPLKIKTAKNNGLRYLVFYTFEEAANWLLAFNKNN